MDGGRYNAATVIKIRDKLLSQMKQQNSKYLKHFPVKTTFICIYLDNINIYIFQSMIYRTFFLPKIKIIIPIDQIFYLSLTNENPLFLINQREQSSVHIMLDNTFIVLLIIVSWYNIDLRGCKGFLDWLMENVNFHYIISKRYFIIEKQSLWLNVPPLYHDLLISFD